MNIVNKLTLRHMLQNKRRTLVTMIGVIVSVAMISAVTTLGLSFLDLMKRESIANSGNWHLKYGNITPDKLETLEGSPYADELLIEHDAGYALLSEQGLTGNGNKPYIHVMEYNEAAFDKLPLKLLDGRLPEKANEIVVPEHYLQQFSQDGQMIGSTMTLNLGERYHPNLLENEYINRLDQTISLMSDDITEESLIPSKQMTYTVVGIIERLNWEYGISPGYSFLAYLDQNALAQDALITARLFSEKPNQGILEEGSRLVDEIRLGTYSTNSELLRYQFVSSHDGFMTTLYSLVAIIMGVIMVGSISLIYNAFGISVADRSRYLGMLASVGATRRQKRNSVFFEGLLISVISIPIGFASALAGLAITFAAINPAFQDVTGASTGLVVKMNGWTILISTVISLVTIFLSVWWPAKRASKVSAIDAIRQTQDVKLSTKQVKTTKVVRKLFGIEADIALKNIKRNKRRYQITVFSLVISIILFLTVSYLTESMKQALFSSNTGVNYDIEITFQERDNVDAKLLTESFDGIKDHHFIQSSYIDTKVASEYIPDSVMRTLVESYGEQLDEFDYSLYIRGLEDDELTSIAAEAGIDAEQLFDKEHPQAIVYNVNSYYNLTENRYVTDKSLLDPQGLVLDIYHSYSERVTDEQGNEEYVYREKSIGTLGLIGTTEAAPLGIARGQQNSPSMLILYVSQTVMQELVDRGATLNNPALYITSDNPIGLEEEIRKSAQFENIYISNVFRYKKEEDVMMLIISVFSYGFISLITLISIANILNTISTSIQLRKREFAMLRSIGMTEKGFYRMINYESILYGLKALLYGLPISLAIMLLIYNSMLNTSYYVFQIPWLSVGIMLVALFLIVGLSMLYSGSKVKKGSIVEAIKQENL
ncbi:ABC transporter permease [Paenibacillus septentrionalis]|uniref:ABC transporter permease n=1 Tax=Paenibacillus septentrionalis TaxID=429342 RepID=A0ABW1V6T7_9BACL